MNSKPLETPPGLESILSTAKATPLCRSGIQDLAERYAGFDLRDAVLAAVANADETAVTSLLLAAAISGRPAGVDVLERALPLVSRPDEVLALVGCARGDRVKMILNLVASERLSHERHSVLLFAATELLEGEPPPAELLREIRLHARRGLGFEAGMALGLAAMAVEDAGVDEVAERWIGLAAADSDGRMAKALRRALASPPEETLPERPVRESPGTFTIRRAAPKVGRNTTCPCGSGKKYKKCCADKDAQRLEDPSPVAGVTFSEYMAAAHKFMSDAEFRRLRPSDLAQLPFEEFSTLQLIFALSTFRSYRYWSQAERVMAILGERTDAPGGDAEGHRVDLIHDAMTAGERDVVKRQVGLLKDRTLLDSSLQLELALLEPTAETLSAVESTARAGLDPSSNDGVDLAHALLDHYPALGILVARAVLDPQRPLDSYTLLEVVEEARDRLGAPPNDVAQEIYDLRAGAFVAAQLDQELGQENEKLREEADGLRLEAGRAAERVKILEQSIDRLNAEVDRTQREREARAPGAVSRALEPAEDREAQRLRSKLSELKGLVKEGHESRNELRAQLAKLSERLAKAKAETSEAERTPVDGGDEGAEPVSWSRLPILVPVVSRRAAEAIHAVPAATARKALNVVASLAAADPSAWEGVKRLTAAPDICLARVGLHYRLLFRTGIDERSLDVLELIPRQALEATVKRYAG